MDFLQDLVEDISDATVVEKVNKVKRKRHGGVVKNEELGDTYEWRIENRIRWN